MSRDPNQWLGLLKWSLQYQDGTVQTEHQPLSDEKKQFLLGAMESLLVDDVKRMSELVTALQEAHDAGTENVSDEELETKFEELVDICSQIDRALDLHKIGKFATIVGFLRSPDARFRSWAAELIGVCVQNNPPVQAVALQTSVLAFLSHLVVFDPSPAVQVKALLGLSCLIRECQAAEYQFVLEGHGLQILLRGATEGATVAIRRKSVHLLAHLIVGNAAHGRTVLAEEWQLDEILNMLGTGDKDQDLDLNEAVVRLILALADLVSDAQARRLAAAIEKRAQLVREIPEATQRQDAEHELGMLAEVLERLQQPRQSPSQPATRPAPKPVTEKVPEFQATAEWQEIPEGQGIPAGLHVRLDMTTGQRWAKLNDPTEDVGDASRMAVVCTPGTSQTLALDSAE